VTRAARLARLRALGLIDNRGEITERGEAMLEDRGHFWLVNII
jgi:hypothetical protein